MPSSWSELRAELKEAFETNLGEAAIDVNRIAGVTMGSPARTSLGVFRVVAIIVVVGAPIALFLAIGQGLLHPGPTGQLGGLSPSARPTGRIIRVDLTPGSPETDLDVRVGDTVAVHVHKDGPVNSAWGKPSYISGQFGDGAILAPEVIYPGNPTPTERDRYFAFHMAAPGEVGIGFVFPTSCTGAQPCPPPAVLLRLHIAPNIEGP